MALHGLMKHSPMRADNLSMSENGCKPYQLQACDEKVRIYRTNLGYTCTMCLLYETLTKTIAFSLTKSIH